MTSKTAAEHDDAELDTTFYAITDVESIAKQVIRQAPDKAHRWLMWDAFSSAMETAAENSTEMPWDPPEAVTRIAARSARRALIKMLEAIPGIPERDRLAKVTAKEAERVEARMESGIPDSDGKHPARHCAGCGAVYRPKRESSRYCGQNCRQAAYRARQAP
jgi:hypothetical protein